MVGIIATLRSRMQQGEATVGRARTAVLADRGRSMRLEAVNPDSEGVKKFAATHQPPVSGVPSMSRGVMIALVAARRAEEAGVEPVCTQLLIAPAQ